MPDAPGQRWSGGLRGSSTGVSIPVLLVKVIDGTEQTGKAASDVTASYWRFGGQRVAISVSDLAAVDSAHSSGGWKETDSTNMPGLYRFDLPDAAILNGTDWVTISVKVAGCFVYHERISLQDSALSDVAVYVDTEVAAIKTKTDFLPSAAAGGTGGLALKGDAMALTSGERNSVADALLDLANGIETGVTPRQALRAMAAMLAGDVTDAGTASEKFHAIGNTATTRVTAAPVDEEGNRTMGLDL